MKDLGRWPDHPTIYQVYPRSFNDSTGSGEGDLSGVIDRLPHIASLGIDAIWLSPFFTSPFCDGGYDVADHFDVDPRFGTLKDFDTLLAAAHDMGLRIIIDMVLNHTSDTHEWFKKSRAREDCFEDTYVWADANPDGSPPTNWIAFFGQGAWHWHPQRGQYCLHKFLPCQPCLNHYDPSVGARMKEVLRFWRDRGVDGFRFDAITSFYHDRQLRDNPPADADERTLIPGVASNPFTMQRHCFDVLPDECSAFASDLRDWAGPETYLLGEVNSGVHSVEVTRAFTAPGKLDAGYTIDVPDQGLTAQVLRDIFDRLDGAGGMAWWLSSHDQMRAVSRTGDGSAQDARLLAAILTALPGPLLLFQGDELGLPQGNLCYDDLQDPFDKMYWPAPLGRDGARVPIPWDETQPHFGFSTARPWLPMALPEDGAAAQQAENASSVLSFHKAALSARRDLGLASGSMKIEDAPEHCIRGSLSSSKGEFLLAANLSQENWSCDAVPDSEPILSSSPARGRIIPPRSAAWWRLG